MVVISIVGSPDSGKTTLIERILPILKKMGLKVAVVKHHAHGDFEFDREGKDSWKHYNTGADVIVASPSKLAVVKRSEDISLDKLVEKYFPNYSLVLTEGFNSAGKPRVVVLNPGDSISRFEKGEILAVVSREKVKGYEEKTFGLEEWDKIAELLFEHVKSSKDL